MPALETPPEADRLFMLSESESKEESPAMLNPETLERLLRQLETTDVDELEIVLGDARIYLRREPGQRTIHAPDPGQESSDGNSGIAITAPLTGIFYGRPSPEQPAFVLEGQSVEPGQVVALIETMKLFNEVTAEQHGEVIRIAVADGDLVDSGQPLVYLQPAEPEKGE
jgi:acetyl-CoA carboxylase biotin carboxyl carrier protein